MRRFVSIGIVLFTCILASAAHALLLDRPLDPDPSPRNCVQEAGLLEADQPLFIAVVSGFFHNAPCKPGEPRVVVIHFYQTDLAPRYNAGHQTALELKIDGSMKALSGENIYEIIGLVAEHLNNTALARSVETPTPCTTPQAEKALGYIRINARPYASVWIDGKDTGLGTPIVKHPLTVGRHTIELKNTKLRCFGKFDVTIQPEQTTSLIKQLDCEQ